MNGGLEVDRRNDSAIAYQKHGEGDKYINGTPRYHLVPEEQAPQRPLQGKRSCRLRPTTLFLSIALALALVLAVVAAGVAGSLAAKRDTRCVSTASCSSSNASSLYSPSAIHNPFHVNDSPFVPTPNCTALGDVYTSFVTQTQFRTLCTTNVINGDLFSVFVYYFTDCIEACAAWNKFPALNLTCHGVTFDYDYTQSPEGQYGNCWLKNSLNVKIQALNRTFSASLVQE